MYLRNFLKPSASKFLLAVVIFSILKTTILLCTPPVYYTEFGGGVTYSCGYFSYLLNSKLNVLYDWKILVVLSYLVALIIFPYISNKNINKR